MRVAFTTALRAELFRAQELSKTTKTNPKAQVERLALFILSLTDEGDLPAWALACELAPDRVSRSLNDPACKMLVGAAPLKKLASTLARAGERELSMELSSSRTDEIPVVLLNDVVRIVTPLETFEAEEIDELLREAPFGNA